MSKEEGKRISNGYTTFFLSPARGNGFYWGVGPIIYYPTATNSELGVNKWGSGASIAVVRVDKSSPWVLGAVVNNIWSFGGPPKSSDRTNSFLLNPIVNYHFGDGWSFGTSANITSNWLAKEGERWTVPVGASISKTSRLGKQPVQIALASYYNAIRPEAKEGWLVQVTLTFVFSK